MRKILVADDNPEILQVMQLLLHSRGFTVDSISDGAEIFSKIESFAPGLIFLDVYLSSYDGRELCKEIKTSAITATIPIILFSANKIKSSTIIESKADAFISKPFDIHDLLDTIDSFLPTVPLSSSMIA